MMYKKALMFGDFGKAAEIMEADHPRKQKAIGREVSGFDKDHWETYCREIVYDANMAKFTQNPDMLDELMFTGDKILVEASPRDSIWGIGLSAEDPLAQSRSTWKGTNWLGQILTQVRDDLSPK